MLTITPEIGAQAWAAAAPTCSPPGPCTILQCVIVNILVLCIYSFMITYISMIVVNRMNSRVIVVITIIIIIIIMIV